MEPLEHCCRDCKRWDVTGEPLYVDPVDCSENSQRQSWRVCLRTLTRPENGSLIDPASRFMACEDGCVFTAPEFGCLQFEAKR